MRSETDILKDLAELCQSKGYLNALAFLCFQNNVVGYGDELRPENLSSLKPEESIIRAEIALLMSLIVKAKIDTTLQSSKITQEHIDRTHKLLKELRQSMLDAIPVDKIGSSDAMTCSQVMKEIMFYSGESAYPFQYTDMSLARYHNDNSWLQQNKGVCIEDVVSISNAVQNLLNDRSKKHLLSLTSQPLEEWTLLPVFSFNVEELSDYTDLDSEHIKTILSLFSVSQFPCNEGFTEIGDFSEVSACPILNLNENEYILFHSYMLAEAIYESPFYWFLEDEAYKVSAQDNRGRYLENFCSEKLARVFGDSAIHQNVIIKDHKGGHLGEIDNLVIYADRAIILQAKSKKLTLAARKGNDNVIKDDFKKAISDSYEQGWDCANLLLNPEVELFSDDGKELQLRRDYKAIYLFCVVSDHYPGLAFQSRAFLSVKDHETIRPPFVMDAFTLDVMAEFLDTPLYFLDYIQKRANFYHKFSSSHEITILSYHLKRNLWLEDDVSMCVLTDDVSQDIDAAFIVRREGLPGKNTPEGLLTVFKGTAFGDLIEHINHKEHAGIVDLGFLLLNMNQETAESISKLLKCVHARTLSDGKGHDFTMPIGDAGLTFHCSCDSPQKMAAQLQRHCELKKYSQKARQWFGIARHAISSHPFDVASVLDFEWEYSEEMEKALNKFPEKPMQKDLRSATIADRKKPGRNQPCPCGSGKKFKKCCYR